MDLGQIRELIETASQDDLEDIIDLVKLRRDQLDAEVGMSLSIGEAVEFNANNNEVVRGKFLGIKRKNASVLTEQGVRWTVSPGFLRKVS